MHIGQPVWVAPDDPLEENKHEPDNLWWFDSESKIYYRIIESSTGPDPPMEFNENKRQYRSGCSFLKKVSC